MNYYYDITLNLGEDNLLYYEWEQEDNFEHYKKIPLFQVTSKTLKDFISHNILVDNTFLELIKGKAKGGTSDYLALFADKNGAIVLEFDKNGKSIYRSNISFLDEVNLLDILYTTEVTNIRYEILEEIPYSWELRKYQMIKRTINQELNYLFKNKEFNKLRYLYIEWFSKEEDNIEIMYTNMKNKIKDSVGEKELKIYEIIKLSYNNA